MWLSNAMTLRLWPCSVVDETRNAITEVPSTYWDSNFEPHNSPGGISPGSRWILIVVMLSLGVDVDSSMQEKLHNTSVASLCGGLESAAVPPGR